MERLRKADGMKLRRLREDRWLTQEQLASLAGVAPATVVRIEVGQNRDPRIRTLHTIAEALGVPPEALLEDMEGADPLVPRRSPPFSGNGARGAAWDLRHADESAFHPG